MGGLGGWAVSVSPLVRSRSRRLGAFAAVAALLLNGAFQAPRGGWAAVGDISTVAGGAGSGHPTKVAQTPAGLAVRANLVYVADSSGHVIRLIDTATNLETVVAGAGPASNDGAYSGDGGPAKGARLNAPSAVAVTGTGIIYIADTYNHVIRKVDAAGTITTFAGTGAPDFGGDGGQAKKARLLSPAGIAVDATGNVYVADTGNNRIRKIIAKTGVITTVAGSAGTGTIGDGGPATLARLNRPSGIALDSAGNIFISDTLHHRIRKVDIASGRMITLAGRSLKAPHPAGQVETGGGYDGDGLPAVGALLNAPRGIAVDSAGNVYFADSFNHRVRKIDTTGIITTFAGNGVSGNTGNGGPATSAKLSLPRGLGISAGGAMYIGESGAARVRKVDVTGKITALAGNGQTKWGGDGGPATGARMYFPGGVVFDGAATFVADTGNNRIRKITSTGTIIHLAGTGKTGFSGDGGDAKAALLAYPYDLALDSAGNLYVADRDNNRIRKISPSGIISTVAGTGTYGSAGDGGPATDAQLAFPFGLAVDSADNLYIADTYGNRIRKVTTSGVITTVAGDGSFGFSGDGGSATAAQLASPTDVAVDGVGNLYVADRDNHRIRRITAEGIITTVAGDGNAAYAGDGGAATSASLNSPEGVAFDGAGNLYVADTANHRIRRVSSGVIVTVAGTGAEGYSGDGALASAARLSLPSRVALTTGGDLVFADSGNHRLRMIDI